MVKKLTASERAKLRREYIQGAQLKPSSKRAAISQAYNPTININLSVPCDLLQAIDEIALEEGPRMRTKVIERMLQQGVEAHFNKA